MSLTTYKKCIMIVDDDADDRAVLEHALSKNFLLNNIVFAKDGTELIDYLFRTGAFSGTLHPIPDIILLDINMPKMSGLEALERIKLHPSLKTIPVIMFTTSSSHIDIKKAYELGASGFILKPNRLEEFIEVTRHVCDYWFKVVKLPS
jgi:CheY-like chemotaxis protein